MVLDPDVAEQIARAVRREGKTIKVLVNETLRARLGKFEQGQAPKPFRVVPHDFGFIAGVDLDKMNQLADDVEAAELSRKLEA